jgi:hypothetical protein
MIRPVARAALASLVPALVALPVSAQEGWRTTATLYLWFPGVVQEIQDGPQLEIDRETILENLDFALAGEIVATRDDFLIGGEIFFADISSDETLTLPIQPGEPSDPDALREVGDADARTTMLSAFGGYKLYDDSDGVIYGTAGLRYARFETGLEAATEQAAFRFDNEEEVLDVTLGIRARGRITENLSLPLIADVGTGGSRFTFQIFGGVSYDFGASRVTAGYRKIEWYLDDGGELFERIEYSGPLVAYSFRF